jgi:hypothetical protein
MDVKELDAAVSSIGSLLKNLDPILNRAEKWSQGQRLAGAIVSLAVAVLLLSGKLPTPALTAFALAIVAISLLTIKRRVLEAELFAVKDKEGRYRAVLASDHKNITLLFLGEKANPLLSLGLTEREEPNVILFDPSLRPRAVLGIPAELGGPTLHLLGSDGKSYFQCTVSNDNESRICMGPAKGAHLLLAAGETRQSVVISDGKNKPRASFDVSETNSVVRLYGTRETEASAELGVYDGTMPALLYTAESGKSVVLFGTKGDGSGS